ncbi:MAG: DUF998 domain-containing protein [Acidimicrobiales bacterium]|nr:DUF998 domain-containing protein [Acidimicrobiales bacterium]
MADASVARIRWAKALSLGGAVAYNWWVVVPFVPGMMPSVNGFFSDLEANGQPHAGLLSDADMLAGVLMVAALFLRGSYVRDGVRREWKWMMAFALCGVIGGRYPYACAEGLNASCRHLEWHRQLPIHHYVHVASGIAEFALLTGAAIIAMKRTEHKGSVEARIYRGLVGLFVLAYPLLGLVYLTDRLGTLVEPIFLVAFSFMFLTEVFEPIHRSRPSCASSGSALRFTPPVSAPAG